MITPLVKKEVESAVRSEATTLELKTLKGLGEEHINMGYGDGCSFCDDSHEGRWISEEQLRQEAIKWVKNLDEGHNEGDIVLCLWIKHFFNLREEDLKGGEKDGK